MINIDEFEKRLRRAERFSGTVQRVWDKQHAALEKEFRDLLHEMDEAHAAEMQAFQTNEERLKGQLEQAAKDYTHVKYKLEREKQMDQEAVTRAMGEMEKIEKHAAYELRRTDEERVNNQISFDKQKRALTDLYEEKMRSLRVTKEKLFSQSNQSAETLNQARKKFAAEIEAKKAEHEKKINVQKEELAAKKAGWDTSLALLKKDCEALSEEKKVWDDKSGHLREIKEKELEAARTTLLLAREQLELDKVSLVEKAEEDQKVCERELQELRQAIETNEGDLQTLILHSQAELKNQDEGYQKEESYLKEAMKSESEKRDYEQKLFLQEKEQRETELKKLQEEFDRRKGQWDNQIRTLTIQKSVQDAEFEAERLRTDREARTLLRGLEAKRDELRQRLADLKSRSETVASHAKKEQELLQQRWSWRKERLWSMWQNRLDLLKKERTALHEQLNEVETNFNKKRADYSHDQKQDETRVENLREHALHSGEQRNAMSSQREIQNELEKTRISAHIKELEGLIGEWMDRQKALQDDAAEAGKRYGEQFAFLDRLVRQEQQEADSFMHCFQRALSSFKGILDVTNADRKAA